MLLAAADDLPDLSVGLANLRSQRDLMKAQLAELTGADAASLPVVDAISALKDLGRAMDKATRPKLREILKRIIDRVEFWWEPRHPDVYTFQGKCKLARGLVVFRPEVHASPIEFGRPELDLLDPAERAAVAVARLHNDRPVVASAVAEYLESASRSGYIVKNLRLAEGRGMLECCEIPTSTGKRSAFAWSPTSHSFFDRMRSVGGIRQTDRSRAGLRLLTSVQSGCA